MRTGSIYAEPERCTLCGEEFRPKEARTPQASASGMLGMAHVDCAEEFAEENERARLEDEFAGTRCRMDTCGYCGRCS